MSLGVLGLLKRSQNSGEDFQDGQILEGVRFVNPFAGRFDVEAWLWTPPIGTGCGEDQKRDKQRAAVNR